MSINALLVRITDGHWIDHVVELQVLQKVTEESKICDVLVEMHHLDKNKTAEAMLAPVKKTFHGSPNLFFLSKKVHERVSWFITAT